MKRDVSTMGEDLLEEEASHREDSAFKKLRLGQAADLVYRRLPELLEELQKIPSIESNEALGDDLCTETMKVVKTLSGE